MPAAGLVLLALAACERPPASAYVPAPSGGAATVAVGRTTAGEECRMARTGTGADLWCGEWTTPSARIRAVPAAPPLEAAATARAGLTAALDCAEPAPTTALGGQPAALMQCRRRTGGWPAFGLVVTAGRTWLAEGILPALPAAERAVGVLSGRVAADAAPLPSAALDLVAAQLARDAFATGDIGRYEALITVGRDANQAERFVAAETAYRAALALQERVLGAGAPGSFAPLVLLALQLSNQGRYPEAEALLARAGQLAPRAADPLAPAMLAHYRGLHEANRGQNDAALASLRAAGQAYARLVPPEAAAASPALQGLPRAGLGFDPLAARALVGLIETRRNAAAVLRSAGRGAEAEAEAAAAERLAATTPAGAGADRIAARLARTGGAAAFSTGALATADGRFARSVQRFARGVPRSRPYAETLLLRAAGLPAAAALPLCRDAAEVLRSLREGVSANRIAPCVDAFVAAAGSDAAAAQALLGEAFVAAQLAQGGVTATQIASAAARLAAGARDPNVATALRRREASSQALAARYRERDAAVASGSPSLDRAALDAGIAAAEAEATDADADAQAAAPGFAQLVQSTATAAEVLAALGPGEALVTSTLPADRRGWTFVLLDGAVTVGPAGADGAAVAGLVQRIRAGVESGDGSKPFDAEAAHALHEALFGSVRAAVERATSLVVVPEGPLLSLPTGLLVTAPPPQPRSHEGATFLLARVPVAHVPAAASLVSLRRVGASRAGRPWYGFGAPQPVPAAAAARLFPAAPSCGQALSGLAALPASEIELAAAAQVMGALATEHRTGAAFTVDAVRRTPLRDYRVLHFATHGLLPGELSCLTEPAIVTSPGGGNATALLTAGTVLDLELDADVVLLSACNSGGGAAAGESLSTLARAFFFAGARALMVTHWYVDDAAAARVTVLTLDKVREGQPAAAALRAAQLALMQVPGGGHPGLWAPFTLLGPGAGMAPAGMAPAGVAPAGVAPAPAAAGPAGRPAG